MLREDIANECNNSNINGFSLQGNMQHKNLVLITGDSTSERVIDFGTDGFVTTTFSVGNVLAVGGSDKVLRLYDVRNWELIHSKEYEMQIQSLQLTSDLKHLVMCGRGGELCIVMQITH